MNVLSSFGTQLRRNYYFKTSLFSRWAFPALIMAGSMMGSAWSVESTTKLVAASVTIDAQKIVMTQAHVAVTIQRNPFHLSVQNDSGTTVLSEVPAIAPPVARFFLQFTPMPSPASYTPLAFLVGTRAHTQYTGVNAGNSSGGSLSGSEYAGTSVFSATQVMSGGADVVVSTSDPSGRQLVIALRPGPDEASIAISVRATPETGVVTISDSFLSDASEAFHGFGGRHNALDQHGQNLYNWVEEENNQTDLTSTNLSPNGPTAAYYVQPMFVSSRPYGFIINQPEMSSFRLASDRADAWQVSVASAHADFVVAAGEAQTVIKSMTMITGRQPVAPDWVLGSIEGQVSPALTALDAAAYAHLVDADLAAIDQYKTPVTGFQLHQWQHFDTATLKHYVDAIHQRKMHVLVYFKCVLDNGNLGYDSTADYNTAMKNGYTVRDGAGNPTSLVDFTNPNAAAWWQQRVRAALDQGIDGFMEDFGEEIASDMQFANGERGDTMHNRYPTLYHQTTRALFDTYQKEHPERELWTYTRSGYNGSASAEGGNFPGDNAGDFGRANGLGSGACDMLNRAIGGAYGFVNDIGGYFDYGNAGFGVPKETYLRWTEWAALSPIFLNHNSLVAGTTHSWTFNDPEAIRIYNLYANLHIRAAPLIRQLWREAQTSGMPIVRPLWLAFPGDVNAAKQDQQWMLGPDVLVAPVVSAGATTRAVYFPVGTWTDPVTHASFTGPATITVQAPLEALPYYFRAGTTPIPDASSGVVVVPPTPVGSPAAPLSLTAVAGNGQASLSWAASPSATSYYVKRGDSASAAANTVATVTGTTATDTGLVNGTTYYYIVTALNSVGESAPSNQVAVKPTPTSGSASSGSSKRRCGLGSGLAAFAAGLVLIVGVRLRNAAKERCM